MTFKVFAFLVAYNAVLTFGYLSWPMDKSQTNETDYNRSFTIPPFVFEDTSEPNNDIDNIVVDETSSLEPTSTNESTNAGEKSTTPSTEPNTIRECLQNQSSFTVYDLKNLIDYIVTKELQLVDTLNGSYYQNAILVRDKHIHNLEDLRKTVEDRPNHLRELLTDLTQARHKEIEPVVKQIASKLQNVSVLVGLYNDKKQRADIVLEKLEKYKRICALNCEESLKNHRRKRTVTKEDYNCDNLQNVHAVMTTSMKLFMTQYKDNLSTIIEKSDKSFQETTKQLKIQIKEKALGLFGSTMYDVLSLEDEYHDFLNMLKNNKVDSDIRKIKKTFLDIDYILEILYYLIEKYKYYCINCSNNQNLRYRRGKDISPADLLNKAEKRDTVTNSSGLVNQVITAKINEIKQVLQDQIHDVFEEIINIQVDQFVFVDNIIGKLKPLQDNIKEAYLKEAQELDTIKKMVSLSSFDRLSELNNTSFHLLINLQLAEQFIKNNIDN